MNTEQIWACLELQIKGFLKWEEEGMRIVPFDTGSLFVVDFTK